MKFPTTPLLTQLYTFHEFVADFGNLTVFMDYNNTLKRSDVNFKFMTEIHPRLMNVRRETDTGHFKVKILETTIVLTKLIRENL